MKKFVNVSVTASNEAKIKEGKEEEVSKLAAKYGFQSEFGRYSRFVGLVFQINNGRIRIYGYTWPNLVSEPKDDDELYCMDDFGEFLKEIAPFLIENLIVHSVGTEECAFPFAAREIKVTPRGKVVSRERFKWTS